MDLLDFQEAKEMLGYLAYQDNLGFQAKKENPAPVTSQDRQDRLDSKVNLARRETQVIKGLQVPLEDQVFLDRKVKKVKYPPHGGQSQDRKVRRDSQVSLVLQEGVFQANQALKAVPVLKDQRAMVVLDILVLQVPQDVQAQMEHQGQEVILVYLVDLVIQDLLADRGFQEKKDLKDFQVPQDHLVQKTYARVALDQREYQDQTAILDHQDLMDFLVQRETRVCLDLGYPEFLDFLVTPVFLGHQAQVHRDLLDQRGSRGRMANLVHQD